MKCKSDNEQLRCPKCGSEMINKFFKCEFLFKQCPNLKCRHQITKTEINKNYQQRLDKVLSKMHKVSSDELVYRKKSDIRDYWFTYSNELKQFFYGTTSQEISLKTVENLLKDLEGNDG